MAPHEPPRGFAQTTWKSVGGWLARQLANGCEKADRPRLTSLAERLRSERLITLDGSTPSADPATPARIPEDPAPTPLRDIIGPYDLRRLRSDCEAMFAAGGAGHVRGEQTLDCERDAQRLRSAYEVAGLQLPPLLHEYDPMTPYRVLTVQFCSGGLQHAFPKHWTVMRNRVLHRGGDQPVLLAMRLGHSEQTASGTRTCTVQQVWATTVAEAPGLTELHNLVRSARR
jgi:hypothetical protein